jgi:hypothetical protein
VQIPLQRDEDGERPVIVVALFEQGCIPKLASCRSPGVAGLHALQDEAIRQHLDVQLDLVFEFVPGPSLAKESPKSCHERANPDGHVYFSAEG